MYFTREPLIETVMTPREGYKLVVRSTRNVESEEYFVDALEVVSFGQALFFRSMERPKCFLVPVSDYEVMEVRETRLILKAAPLEKGVKIGGGREASIKSSKDVKEEKHEDEESHIFEAAEEEEEVLESDFVQPESPVSESKLEKRRERRRHRRRKSRADEKEEVLSTEVKAAAPVDELSESYSNGASEDIVEEEKIVKQPVDINLHFSSLIPPPPTLISETINQYRNNENFKKAFVQPEETSEESVVELDEQSEQSEKLEDSFSHESTPNLESEFSEKPYFESHHVVEDVGLEQANEDVIREENIEKIDAERTVSEDQQE